MEDDIAMWKGLKKNIQKIKMLESRLKIRKDPISRREFLKTKKAKKKLLNALKMHRR